MLFFKVNKNLAAVKPDAFWQAAGGEVFGKAVGAKAFAESGGGPPAAAPDGEGEWDTDSRGETGAVADDEEQEVDEEDCGGEYDVVTAEAKEFDGAAGGRETGMVVGWHGDGLGVNDLRDLLSLAFQRPKKDFMMVVTRIRKMQLPNQPVAARQASC
jgi:hypothetical protein